MLLRNFPERLMHNLCFKFSDFMKDLVLKYNIIIKTYTNLILFKYNSTKIRYKNLIIQLFINTNRLKNHYRVRDITEGLRDTAKSWEPT